MGFEKIYCNCGQSSFNVWHDEIKRIVSLTCVSCHEEQQIEF